MSTKRVTIINELTDPAYICCSSGTTARPKLILNTLEGIHLRVKEHAGQVLDDNPNQSLLGFSDFDFDASIMDTLMALYKGISLYVVPRYIRKNVFHELPLLFKQCMAKNHPITSGVMLPFVLSGVEKKGLNPDDFPGLKRVVTMGDTCNPLWIKPLLQKSCKVFNGYGHTETSIASLVATLSLADQDLPLVSDVN
jgi:acyl-coenzyme A synthetase/AMP-(fatty) acid ligase